MSDKKELDMYDTGYVIIDSDKKILSQSWHRSEMESWYIPALNELHEKLELRPNDFWSIDCILNGPLFAIYILKTIEDMKRRGYAASLSGIKNE